MTNEIIMGFTIAGLVLLICSLLFRRMALNKRRSRDLRLALKGALDDGEVAKLLRNPEQFNEHPTDQMLTLLSVEIVGFSALAETLSSEKAFALLKDIFQAIAKIIYEEGGVVDKMHGDGLIAFFGYRFSGSIAHHADQAVRCASKLQSVFLDTALRDAAEDKPVFPLRIGISTGRMHVASVRRVSRLEPMVIGSAVAQAKFLEKVCEPFFVLVSNSTRDLLTDLDLATSLTQKKLPLFRGREEYLAFEFDALASRAKDRAVALQSFRKWTISDRGEERVLIDSEQQVFVRSDCGEGRLIDVSASGLGFEFSAYVARGTELNLEILSTDAFTQAALVREKLGTLSCVVRWSRPLKNDIFLCGVEFRGLPSKSGKELTDLLRRRTIA